MERPRASAAATGDQAVRTSACRMVGRARAHLPAGANCSLPVLQGCLGTFDERDAGRRHLLWSRSPGQRCLKKRVLDRRRVKGPSLLLPRIPSLRPSPAGVRPHLPVKRPKKIKVAKRSPALPRLDGGSLLQTRPHGSRKAVLLLWGVGIGSLSLSKCLPAPACLTDMCGAPGPGHQGMAPRLCDRLPRVWVPCLHTCGCSVSVSCKRDLGRCWEGPHVGGESPVGPRRGSFQSEKLPSSGI